MSEQEITNKELLHMEFNQNNTCFSCGTTKGFRIHTTDPYGLIYERDMGGSIDKAIMLYKCNILAIIGGGNNPRYPLNTVMIWDDNLKKCIGELKFRSKVKAVKLRREFIVVVLDYRTYIYNFRDFTLHDSIDTPMNETALCDISYGENNFILICPGLQQGSIRVNSYNYSKVKYINAHDSRLESIVINNDGTLIASASEKGTVIKIFDAKTGEYIQELRRGMERTRILSLAFSFDKLWVACSSEKDTIHIFRLKGNEENNNIQNPKSRLSFMSSFLPKYFNSERSFASYKINDNKTIVGFSSINNNILVLGSEGNFYRLEFDHENINSMTLIETYKF